MAVYRHAVIIYGTRAYTSHVYECDIAYAYIFLYY